jgi:GTP-binding protein LepA
MESQKIRNYCIIAHIDHGKSTLADRMLEVTGTVEHARAQSLDTMDLERERGITIKLQPVRMNYSYQGTDYTLNLIDTPGHVDFQYEVSRSLAAVEGAILLVDATQGIQAQTLANLHLAQEHDLTIVPVVNKIDLPAAEPEKTAFEIAVLLNIDPDSVLFASGKTGEGVKELIETIIDRVPAPEEKPVEAPLRALVFDSIYDTYRGVVAFVRVVEGTLQRGDRMRLIVTGKETDVLEVGSFGVGKYDPSSALTAGEIGYIITGLKDVAEARVGDTITKLPIHPTIQPLPGYQEVVPMVYAGLFTTSGDDYPLLRDALLKLKLNDASLFYEPETSKAFGFGFRCGFLGLLHLEIVKERLEREYNLSLVVTTPTVQYHRIQDGSKEKIEEPFVRLEVITPNSAVGGIMELVQSHRGTYLDMEYVGDRVIIRYDVPLAEIIVNFYDELKSASSGYASMSYYILDWREEDLVDMDILIAEEPVEAFNQVVHRSKADKRAKEIVERLKELIPQQNFEVKIQAAIGAKIIASERLSALRKDVTAKLYGGDVTRKNKLLDKQKKGKKKMKMLGKVEVPTTVFLELLKH